MNNFRIGFGYDSHRFGENLPFFMGGVAIPFEKGCVAHSDGDALIHALCDALLGAANLKDIGTHFPDNVKEFEKIDSKILLAKVVELVHDKGFAINNVDITIIIEKPKMAPHIDSMTKTLCPILHIDPEALSIKAKTNEKMGFVGSGEGVAVCAVATIVS